jgi:L-ribulose-5-phosphate 3-epimerase
MTESDNNNIPLGLYEKALPESFSWEEKFLSARDAGYSFIELSIDESDERIARLEWDDNKKRDLRDLSEKTGIPLLSICLSANRRFPIGSSHKDIQKRGVEIIMGAIRFAFQMGIRIVQVSGYDVLTGERSTDLSRETFRRNLKKCLKAAALSGVMLAIENVDSESADSLDRLMQYVDDIDSPWLQLYPDIGNLTAMDQDVIKQIKDYGNHIAAVHIKDTMPKVVRNIPFSDGNVDFISAFDALSDIGFCGPMLLEMWADKSKDNLATIKASREWVVSKMKESSFLNNNVLYSIESK